MFGQRLLSLLLVFFLIGVAANAFTQTSVPDKSKQVVTEAAPGAEQEIAPVKTEKIDEVGEKVGALLASLGIGGLAVALAARDTIANFFGTLTILYDKPFQIGERIIIDNYDGVVEKVGFRSTRIRLLTGHLVTIPNEKVVNSGLENIAKRPHIRWLTNN